jgi:hypothetical protein
MRAAGYRWPDAMAAWLPYSQTYGSLGVTIGRPEQKMGPNGSGVDLRYLSG